MEQKLRNIKRSIVWTSVLLFVLSLTQTAITYRDFDGQKTLSALSLLVMGGLAVLGGGFAEWLVWLANPLYVVAIIVFIRSKKSSKKFSVAATILALWFTTWKEILAAENGRTATILHLNAGYWLWVLSLVVLSVGIRYYFRQADTV